MADRFTVACFPEGEFSGSVERFPTSEKAAAFAYGVSVGADFYGGGCYTFVLEEDVDEMRRIVGDKQADAALAAASKETP